MKIVICGMSGFIGQALAKRFKERRDEVQALSIRTGIRLEDVVRVIEGADVIINLAGASILGRWSLSYKETLRRSRLDTTNIIVQAIALCQKPPSVLLNASAVGVYDSEHQHDETSRYFGNDFLANLVLEWESAAVKAKSDETRVCLMRFGVVYGRGGGAMEKMLPPFKMGFGGKMGDGFQMISWIHLEDLVEAFVFVMSNTDIEGVVNITSPEPINNLEQTATMAKVLHRPAFFDMPAWIVKLIFGEGSIVMLDSKEVYPRVLQEHGFQFRYPTFGSALEQIVHDPKPVTLHPEYRGGEPLHQSF